MTAWRRDTVASSRTTTSLVVARPSDERSLTSSTSRVPWGPLISTNPPSPISVYLCARTCPPGEEILTRSVRRFPPAGDSAAPRRTPIITTRVTSTERGGNGNVAECRRGSGAGPGHAGPGGGGGRGHDEHDPHHGGRPAARARSAGARHPGRRDVGRLRVVVDGDGHRVDVGLGVRGGRRGGGERRAGAAGRAARDGGALRLPQAPAGSAVHLGGVLGH